MSFYSFSSANEVACRIYEAPEVSMSIRGRSYMMFALEGGRGRWKSRHSEGGCVNFMAHIRSECGQVGEGVEKSKNNLDVIYGSK